MAGDYLSVRNYLDSLVNYEKISFYPYKNSLKLERVFLLFRYLKIPYERLKVIHIAGTKGKGSTANFCSNLLASSGLKVGVYTSPHIFDFRERVLIKQQIPAGEGKNLKIQSRWITKTDVVKVVKNIKSRLKSLKIPKNIGKVTFFEVYTAVAIKYFLEKKVDIAVLETGLGGRLDATNIVYPAISLITHIGYDHTDKLGEKLKEIAYEKAGIIKHNVPVVCSCQRRAALEVIQAKAKEKKAPFYLLGRDFYAENIRLESNYTVFDFRFRHFKLKKVKIKLKGKYQVENAALALMAMFILKEKGTIEKVITSKIDAHKLEGRFEKVSNNPLVIVDIAHNISSFSVLAENLRLYFPQHKVILIFACSQDKDAKGMLRQIEYRKLIVTSFNTPRAYDPLQIKEICHLKDVVLTRNLEEALSQAMKVYERGNLILISGSLFLVSEAKKLLKSGCSWS